MAAPIIRWTPPGPVAAKFVASDGDGALPIDILLGPVGSGKTVACVVRLLRHAAEMPPCRDGIRRSRIAVVRNTGPMLDTTTIPTVLHWIPENIREFSMSPPRTLRIRAGDVDSQWIFLPLERPEDVRRLLSLDLTGAWINELREVPRDVVTQLRRRCGRYPPLAELRREPDGPVPSFWAGIIADTNAPERADHWLSWWCGLSEPPEWLPAAEAALAFRPEGVTVFRQPPAVFPVRDASGEIVGFDLNPDAENLANLRDGYYRAQISGSRLAEIMCMLACEPASDAGGRPVHPTFRRNLHVAPEPIEYDPRRPVLLGMDVGRDPAVVAAQLDPRGRLLVIEEFVGTNISVHRHAMRVVAALRERVPSARCHGWCDPAGDVRSGGDERTPIHHARLAGLDVRAAPSNDPERRRHALERRLTRLIDGSPAILVSPRCRTLVAGLAGEFRYSDRDPSKVLKNAYSHVCEALEYLVLGLDAGGAASRRPVVSDAMRSWDPLSCGPR